MNAVIFITFLLTTFVTSIIVFGHFLVLQFRKRRVRKAGRLTVGVFHPHCHAGGGGEKVLWCAIRALQTRYPNVDITVYTGDTHVTPEQILAQAVDRLNVALPRPVSFVYLRSRELVEAHWYPVCTLLGQSLGSVVLGAEAMWRYLPDVYLDTVGYSWTLPLFSWVGGCHVSCYVHYPTITSDMFSRVSSRIAAHNNRGVVARSSILTIAKLLYYRAFAWIYRRAGQSADVVMVNSSWTRDHIVELWQPRNTHLVYPPCDIDILTCLQHTETEEVRIVSLGQFRPEKDHPLQIKVLQIIKSKISADIWSKIKLVLVGSCRNSEDDARVSSLQQLAEELSISNNVEFCVNVSFQELKRQLTLGTVGLLTMWNEHFGVGVVECMAAGLIMLAHRSGGPKMDIVDEREASRTGFLAETADEFADAILRVINMPSEELDSIRRAARKSVERFTVESFEEKFLAAMSPILNTKQVE